ncbi:WW domain-containing protein [Plasmodiophora brassicae]
MPSLTIPKSTGVDQCASPEMSPSRAVSPSSLGSHWMVKLYLLRNVPQSVTGSRPQARMHYRDLSVTCRRAQPVHECGGPSGSRGMFKFQDEEMFLFVTPNAIRNGPDGPVACITLELLAQGVSMTEMRPQPLGFANFEICPGLPSFATKWIPIYGSDIQHRPISIGEVLVGIFPLMPAPHVVDMLPSSKDDVPRKTWFRSLRTSSNVNLDPVSERETSMIKKYIRQLLSQPEDKHPDGILLILTLLKSKHCRITFITEMVKVSATKPLFYTTFMRLLDACRALLREAANQKDYKSCDLLLHLSRCVFTNPSPGDPCLAESADNDHASMFLYSEIKTHPVYRLRDFWEYTLTSIVEHYQTSGGDGLQLQSLWSQSLFLTNQQSLEHLLCSVGLGMIHSGVPQCEIAPFVSEQGELYELDMRSIARVLSFIQALHLRDPPGVALSPRKGFPEDEWHWSMDPNVQSLNLEKKAFDPLHRDSDQKPVVVHKFESRGKWTRYQTDDGRDYYFNSETQETRWKCPGPFD